MHGSSNMYSSFDEYILDFTQKDPLERCLASFLFERELERKYISFILEVPKTILALKESKKAIIVEEEHKPPDNLVLKQLPKYPNYPFLGNHDKKLVIYSHG